MPQLLARRANRASFAQDPEEDPAYVDATILGDEITAREATSEFMNNVRIASTNPLTYLTKLERYEVNEGFNVMKWNVGIMELWIFNSTDLKSDAIGILPKLTYPTIQGDGDLPGVWAPIERGKELPAEFISKDEAGETIFTANFAVYRGADGDPLIGEFSLTSEKLGDIPLTEVSLFNIHEQPQKV